MQTDQIARAAHEIERAYIAGAGDDTVPSWEAAPEWMKDSATSGVDFIIAHPDASLSDLHQNWMSMKAAQGWTFGTFFDADKKTHPRYLPYDQLSEAMRMNAVLFMAVVKTLASSQTDSSGHMMLHQAEAAEAPAAEDPIEAPGDEPSSPSAAEPAPAESMHELPQHDESQHEQVHETEVKPDPSPALPEGHATDPLQEEAHPETHVEETGQEGFDSHQEPNYQVDHGAKDMDEAHEPAPEEHHDEPAGEHREGE